MHNMLFGSELKKKKKKKNNLTRLLLRHLFKHIANTLNFVKIQPLVFEIFLATESHKTHTHTWWNNGPFFYTAKPVYWLQKENT